ncbi:MAG: hypothetical protein NTV22_12490 [bacterium]|nr:hypothetical protein [bacterium]
MTLNRAQIPEEWKGGAVVRWCGGEAGFKECEYRISNKELPMLKFCADTSSFDIPCSIFDIHQRFGVQRSNTANFRQGLYVVFGI